MARLQISRDSSQLLQSSSYIDTLLTTPRSLYLFFPLSPDEPNGEELEDAELPRGVGIPKSMFLTNLHGYLHGQLPFCPGNLLPTLFDREANVQRQRESFPPFLIRVGIPYGSRVVPQV